MTAARVCGIASLDRAHLLVDKVQVLGQAEHSDERGHVLLHVLLLQLLHLPGHGVVHAARDLVGQAAHGLNGVQDGIVLGRDGS